MWDHKTVALFEKILAENETEEIIKCRELYAAMSPLSKIQCYYYFERAEEIALKNMGTLSNAELAVKLAAYIDTHTKRMLISEEEQNGA